MNVTLLRLTADKARPQRGVLVVDGEPKVVSLELPWRDNEFSLSCIPAGKYQCKRDTNRTTNGGLKIPVTYEVMSVPGRSGILFHIGNTTKDTQGCILVGSKFGELVGHSAILESKVGFDSFLQALGGKSLVNLEVRWL